MEKRKVILRWIAVLPASVAGMFIGYAFVQLNNFLFNLQFGMETGFIMRILLPIIANAASGYLFVIAGTYTAPSQKKIVSIILTVLFTIFITFSLILDISINRGLTVDFWLGIVGFIAAVVACVRVVLDKEEGI